MTCSPRANKWRKSRHLAAWRECAADIVVAQTSIGKGVANPWAVSGQTATEPTVTLMKSRRRIAFTKAGTTLNRTRLQQGFATDEMGFRDQVAQQQF
jgi:hypothetical protein